MTDLQIFNSPEFGQIRTIEKDGEPWFVGKDVAAALGYSNTKDAILSHVDDEDKTIIQRSEIATIENNIPKSAFPVSFVSADIPNRGITIINESGLYSLVLSSKLPTAKKFKRWVTSEVIPSVRKTGGYSLPRDLSRLSPEMQMLKLLTDKAIENELAQQEQARQLQQVEQKVEHIRELVGINPNGWREDCRKLIVKIAHGMGGNEYIREVNNEVFGLVDKRAGVSLETRLTNKRRRMAEEGICKSKRDRLSKVDVIAEDKKLIEIYIKVVRELAVKYNAA